MDKGTRLYQTFIDDLVRMTKSCVDASNVEKGEVRGAGAENEINEILAKLSDSERKVLSEYVLDAYSAGIYDTLEQLEWLRECKNLVLTAEGEVLPAGRFEGMPCDYIGRKNGWQWPEE